MNFQILDPRKLKFCQYCGSSVQVPSGYRTSYMCERTFSQVQYGVRTLVPSPCFLYETDNDVMTIDNCKKYSNTISKIRLDFDESFFSYLIRPFVGIKLKQIYVYVNDKVEVIDVNDHIKFPIDLLNYIPNLIDIEG